MTHHRAQRLRPVSGRQEVLRIWEETVGRPLRPERRDEFLARAELAELSQLSVGLLETAADISYLRDGRLLLASWLAVVPQALDAMPENRGPRERSYGHGDGFSTRNYGGISSVF